MDKAGLPLIALCMKSTVVLAHVVALISKLMSTTDGAIDQKKLWFRMHILFSTSETVMQMKHLPSAKL